MASLNVDLNYFDHPKTMRLVARLGPGSDVLPIRLWAYVGRHHPESGSLALLESEIEHICGWWGKKGELIAAMIEIGFLKSDGDFFQVNDWHEHSGHLATFKKRAVKAARKRWGVKSKSSNASSIAKREPKQSPSSAVQCSSLPTEQVTPPPVPAGAFEIVWEKYPRKLGREEARTKFKAQVKTEKDFQDIQAALDKFIQKIKADRTEEQFIPHGSTWFNNRWRDWIDYRAVDVKPTFVSRPYVEKLPTEDEMVDPKAVQDLLNGIKAARR